MLLDATETKVAITKSITALKQNAPTTQASIKIPQAVATIADLTGEDDGVETCNILCDLLEVVWDDPAKNIREELIKEALKRKD